MKNTTIHNQLANNVEVPLDHNALGDLRWWVDSLSLANGHPIRISLPHLVIQSDACYTGWGAVSNGVDTRGTWTREETSLHVDCKRCLLDHYARHLCSW